MIFLCLLFGCAGTRTTFLTDHRYTRLHPGDPVAVYLETIDHPYKEIAFIDSEAYANIDDEIKMKQLEQLRSRARSLGANVIQEVRILPRNIRGYTIDEAVPFASWKQGAYQVFFMRGKAVRAAGGGIGGGGTTPEPEGWVVDRLPLPARLAE